MSSIRPRLAYNPFSLRVTLDMAPEDIIDVWHTLHIKQFDWAFEAYRRLISTLSKDVQEKLLFQEGAPEPYVVIFGKTQVGKTTLLLDLMGIDPAQMHIVSEVLRGGREQGKSATATAMEYCSSIDARWGLTIQGKTTWVNTDQEMSHELGKLRKTMESGHLIVDSPCVVLIPQHYFGAASISAPRVRILDLPGDNPANEEEQNHVYHMAKSYLPFADLILLIGRGDDLSFLRPEAISLPRIEDWQAMPNRFRIVTTYSYTAQSIKEFLCENPNADKTMLRQRLIQEIERFGIIHEAARLESLYFPLEFGTSWMSAQQNNPKLYNQISPIIAQLRGELLDQITQATTPIGRLRNTLSTHLSVKYIQRQKIAATEARFIQIGEKEKKVKSEVTSWQYAIDKEKNKIQKLEEIINSEDVEKNHLVIEKWARSFYDCLPASNIIESIRSKKKDRKTLQNLIKYYYDYLLKKRLSINLKHIKNKKYWSLVSKYITEPDKNKIRDILDNEFGPIRVQLDDYWIDTYLLSENYKKDFHSVLTAAEQAQNQLVRLWTEIWIQASNRVKTDYQNQHYQARLNLDLYLIERKKSDEQVMQIEAEKLTNRAELEHIERSTQEDLERCNRFVHFLDEEYLATLNKGLHRALDHNDDCDALLQLLSCVELKNSREELMEFAKKSTI